MQPPYDPRGQQGYGPPPGYGAPGQPQGYGAQPQGGPAQAGPGPMISPDGGHAWNGYAWVPVAATAAKRPVVAIVAVVVAVIAVLVALVAVTGREAATTNSTPDPGRQVNNVFSNISSGLGG